MFEQALTILAELVAQLSRLNDNLESKTVSAPKAEAPAPKKTEKPATVKTPKSKAPVKKEVEEEEEDDEDEDFDDEDDDVTVTVTADEVKTLAAKAIGKGNLGKQDIKDKISELGADSLADCGPSQLAEVYEFIKESL
jgi:hypothetical protein